MVPLVFLAAFIYFTAFELYFHFNRGNYIKVPYGNLDDWVSKPEEAQGEIAHIINYTQDRVENMSDLRTRFAEVVQLSIDPEQLSFKELLEVFWKAHDPTQFNRQGPDVGTQYRSAIFYHSEDQRAVAEASKNALDTSGRLARPVATEITAAGPFWPAEDYHQQYLAKRGLGSCHI